MIHQQRHVTWAPGMSLAALERDVILSAYCFYRENKAATANSLGIAVNTLTAKLKLYEEQDIKHQEANDEQRERDRKFLERSRGIHTGFDTSATPIPEQHQKKSVEADRRVDAQPIKAVTEEHPVSVPERDEIQDVLPAKVAAGGNRQRR